MLSTKVKHSKIIDANLSINEIQADVQQSVFEQVKEEGKKRINPFNKEAQAGLLLKPKESVRNKIDEILKKGMFRTEEEGYQLNKLLQEVLEQEDYIRAIDIRDEINKKTAQKKS